MNYKAIGVMSGSSLDGIDIVYAHFASKGSHWEYEIVASQCIPYPDSWKNKLLHATTHSAYDYLLLHVDYGKYLGEIVKKFISDNNLDYKVQLIASHGHTVFHAPHLGLSHQLGEGAAIAATTGIPVVSDLRTMDIAFRGQGAPIVPIGEKKLFPHHSLFLNIGGIANLSAHLDTIIGFDVCPANRVLNMLAEKEGRSYDDKGQIARTGKIQSSLLTKLNALEYYQKDFPKSLSNAFALDYIMPLINEEQISNVDLLCTYTEHIAQQISVATKKVLGNHSNTTRSLMITGGGAFNDYLIERIRFHLPEIEIHLPDAEIIEFKEALIMALIGVLRWREEPTVINTVTGAQKESIGGAIWSGHL